MNEFDAVLTGVVIISSIIGYYKGFIKEAFGIVSVIISALVTYIYFKNGGSLISLSLVFIFTNLGLTVAFRVMKMPVKQGETKLPIFYRLGGGAVGFFKGVAFMLIVLAALRFFGGMINTAVGDINKYTKASVLYGRYQEILNVPRVKETAASLKEQQGPLTLSPEAVNKLTENNSVRAILEDQQLKESIRRKDYSKILSNPKFHNLLNDKEFLKQVVALGLQQSRQSVWKNGRSKEQ